MAELEIVIDKARQEMQVAERDRQPLVWLVSTGNRTHETPSGNYTPFRLEETHFSVEFDSAPMPHSIFFTKRGHAIHGTNEIRNLGKPVSHGCVRLHPSNASTLFKMVKEIGLNKTSVSVIGSSQREQPEYQPRYQPQYQPPPQYYYRPSYRYLAPPPPPPWWYYR